MKKIVIAALLLALTLCACGGSPAPQSDAQNTDNSGLYLDSDGNPYQYNGHFSWVYFLNDETECNEHGETAWEFIGGIVNP